MNPHQKRFGKIATKLLKANNNKLPKRNECSDTRHRFMYQKWQDPKRKKWCTVRQSKCKTSRQVRLSCAVTCKLEKGEDNSPAP